jgi:hypothetical protein
MWSVYHIAVDAYIGKIPKTTLFFNEYKQVYGGGLDFYI